MSEDRACLSTEYVHVNLIRKPPPPFGESGFRDLYSLRRRYRTGSPVERGHHGMPIENCPQKPQYAKNDSCVQLDGVRYESFEKRLLYG